MKIPKIYKISILILIIITLTGCNTNYKSLNDMSIISSLLIDKKDDKFITYIELYKEEKSENKSKKLSYYITGTGHNIEDAINNASSLISKELYLVHMNTVIFSKEIAQNNLEDVFNYLETKVQINSNYYILISDNIKELMDSKNEDNPILGEKISNLIKYSSNNGPMINYDYLEKLKNYVSNKKDIFLNKVEIENKNITIKNGYYFHNNNLVGTLNNDELKLLNLFSNFNNLYFTFKIDNKQYIIKINNCDINYKLNNEININLNIKGNIYYADKGLDLNNVDLIEKINSHTKYSLKRRIEELLNKLINNKSDIIGINNYIYKINGYQKLDMFKDKININIDVKTNKKGLIQSTLGGSK